MAAANLQSLIEKEYQDVQKAREELLAKRREIDEQLQALDLRIRAAENYKATLEGKFTSPTRTPSKPRARKSSGPRAARGSREQLKSQIIDLLKQHPEGLASNRITAALPRGAKQIPNVLSVMKKDGQLDQEVKRGPYRIASGE